MKLTVDIQVASDTDDVPEPDSMRRWAGAVVEYLPVRAHLPQDDRPIELSITVVDREESQALNAQYRGKDKPTNVLSFPAELPEGLPMYHLGDLVICTPVVEAEARDQGKPLESHWAHMIVHGILHLLGYDHIQDDDAVIMESMEVNILAGLQIPDPYQPHSLTTNSHS